MQRRDFIFTSAAFSAMTAGAFLSGASQARTPQRPLAFDAMGELRTNYEPALIRRMQQSGIDAITVTLCDPKSYEGEAFVEALKAVREHDAFIAAHPQLLVKATKTDHIDIARRNGQIAVFYLFQNSTQFGRDLNNVDKFYQLGVRSAQLTYNDQNWAGSGCKELGANGLTLFGRDLIDRMNQCGMLLDLSHVNMQTMGEAIRHSAKPVIISHTALSSVHTNTRNTSDENLRLLAQRGGVVGICQIRPFLTQLRDGALEDYFRHIDHAVNICGSDHVGIGSDRDHRVVEMDEAYIAELKAEEGSNFNESEWPLFINELNGPHRMEILWDGLRKRGYPAGTAEKIMGTNVRRIYQEVIG
ncbi:dipeptidase [Sphingopyxis yananensis]|uniref:dipeptidase n=1 Tax=Sphingopyxis yananensis TaxID=2886687 RepID=UPI001D123348|nr:membrane dipeptidase [Sphingopyxis yananensis]MCC2603664.1 dipeptidase [Sphingopyxis yananensis]